MKQAKNSLKNVNVNQLEITLNKCLVWFYSYPRNKIGLTDLAQSINSSKTAAKLVRAKAWPIIQEELLGSVLMDKIKAHATKIAE